MERRLSVLGVATRLGWLAKGLSASLKPGVEKR